MTRINKIATILFLISHVLQIASGAWLAFQMESPHREDIIMSDTNQYDIKEGTHVSTGNFLDDLLLRQSICLGSQAPTQGNTTAAENALSENNLLSMRCYNMVRKLKIAMEFDYDQARSTGKANWSRIAEWVYKWLKKHGATFLKTPTSDLYMYYKTQTILMKKSDMDFKSLLFEQVGIPVNSKEMKTVIDTLIHLAYVNSISLRQNSWLHTDMSKLAVYLHLNNDNDEIVRITPNRVTVMKNGYNTDGVFLMRSKKIEPIHYKRRVKIEDGMVLLRKLVTKNLALSALDADFLTAWFMAYPLMDFAADTKPHARFQGGVGSGKTTASKHISAVLFGSPQQKIGTMASNYSDATTSPMVILDNIETHNVDKGLIDFILTTSTNIGRERRKPGTLNENIIEYTKTLINTTGIEPLGAHLSEIMTRTLLFDFDQSRFGSDYFSEAKVVEEIRQNRDVILSALFKKVSTALALIRDGYHEKTVRLLKQAFGSYSKSRCNEYIALMYIMRHADDVMLDSERFLQFRFNQIEPAFALMVLNQEKTNRQLVIDSHAISCCLDGLFNAFTNFYTAYMKGKETDPDKFHKEFGIKFATHANGEHYLENIGAKELHNALKKFAAKSGLEYKYTYPSQLGQRIRSDREIISQAGFDIQFGEYRNYKQYTVKVKPHTALLDKMNEEAEPTFEF